MEWAFLFGVFSMPLIWFYAILTAWVITEIVLVEKEHLGGLFFWLVIFLLFTHLGGIWNVFSVIPANPLKFFVFLFGYFLIGILWSMFKFKLHLRKLRIEINDTIIDCKAVWKNRNDRNDSPVMLKEYIDNTTYPLRNSMALQYNKERILIWCMWWPFSMVWAMLRDFVKNLFDYLINDVFKRAYEKMIADEKKKINME
jgi:hypothetical protein